MASFFDRLKQRKLFQWALAYAAGAWAVLEATDLIGGQFDWPQRLLQSITVLVIVGFFVTLVLAWYHGERGRQRVSGPELTMITVLLVIAGGVLSFIGRPDSKERTSEEAVPPPPGMADDPRPSVAALPFDNLSPDPGDAYIAAGFHEAVLTHLARIATLKVISRTSVLEYQDQTKNIREIAEELGVANILEGSVQRAGDRLRITVQLIDARTDEHLWAESYDRDLSDIFAIQGDVATRVAERLEAALAPDALARIDSPPTQDPEAYAFYLQALELGPLDGRRESLLSQAVQLDPSFALAHATLASLHMDVYWWREDRSEDRLRTAKAALDRAFDLDPDLPEAHFASGYYYYWGHKDYLRATREFALAAEGLPNAAPVHSGLGHVLRRSGRFEEAVASYQMAVQLDPRSTTALVDLLGTQSYLRRFEEAEATHARLAALLNLPVASQALWYLALRQGDGERAERMLATLTEAGVEREYWPQASTAALIQRDYRRAAEVVERAFRDVYGPVDISVRQLYLGDIYGLLDRPQLALAHYDSARVQLEAEALQRPSDDRVLGALAIAYAGLGRDDEAVATARKAAALVPPERDFVSGGWRLVDLTRVYAMVGDVDAAVDQLGWLLRNPSGMTVGRLRAEPRWDPLRDHPRFQALLEHPPSMN
jgi:serine/threonine-protein kinase